MTIVSVVLNTIGVLLVLSFVGIAISAFLECRDIDRKS